MGTVCCGERVRGCRRLRRGSAARAVAHVTRAARERGGDLGFEIREQALPREFLYLADEAFFCGTAVEITPIRSVDKITVGGGRRGPVTAALQERFFGIVKGELPDEHNWLTPVGSVVATR